MSGTHYDTLGVAESASLDELHQAYRNRARDLHPDRHSGRATDIDDAVAHLAMADLNAAWTVLSDPITRRAYDQQIAPAPPPPPPAAASPASTGGTSQRPTPGARREAWLESMREQMVRLGNQAGRSATMSLSLPTGRDRPHYTAVLEEIIGHLTLDTATRIRRARALGAAPLDLWVVAALVGLGSYAEALGARIARDDPDNQDETIPLLAALVDRMWDLMAHEVPHDIANEIGGNPHLTRRLQPSASRSSRLGRRRARGQH